MLDESYTIPELYCITRNKSQATYDFICNTLKQMKQDLILFDNSKMKNSPRIPVSVQGAIHRAIQYIHEQQGWMVTNKLKINKEKTKAFLLCKNSKQARLHVSAIEIGNATVTFRESARNLKVMFDQTFNMDAHRKFVCQSAYLQLCTISRIRRMAPPRAAEQLTHEFSTSRLDTCNSLLFGLIKKTANDPECSCTHGD